MRTPRTQFNYPTDVVFAAACYADRINNGEYFKVAGTDETTGAPQNTNRVLVERCLSDQTLLTQGDRDLGEQVRKYYQSLTFKILKGITIGEFDHKAMSIADTEQISDYTSLALVAALPKCYRRALANDQANSKLAFASGGMIGDVGDKVETKLKVLKCVYSHIWQVYFISGITNQDQAVFFSYRSQVKVDDTVYVSGTVKCHRDNATQLNRVKIFSE